MNVTVDPIWPWTQLFAGDSLGAGFFAWVLSHGLSLLLVVVPLALIGGAAWTYFANGASRRRVLAVLALRMLAFLLAILAILRPALGVPDRNSPRRQLLVAVDVSKSMTIVDEGDNQSRWAYLLKLLKDSRASIDELQDKQSVDVVFYRFAGDTTAAQPDDLGQPDGNRTDIGAMLRTLYEQRDQRRRLGLLVLSDGADNGTSRPPALVEAPRWRTNPACPIYTFAFGNKATDDRTRDIEVTTITTQPSEPVPVKARMTVVVTIDAPGFENQRARVHLLFDDKEVMAPQSVPLPLTRGNEIKLTANAPDKPGEIKVTVRVDPGPGETIVTNNEISTFVTISKEGLSVLLVDRPRDGEPQSISDALSRNNRIRVTNVWLRGAAPLDADTAALLDCDKNPYDVIIIGDVTAGQMLAANPVSLRNIRKHVNKGAGLIMIGGYNTFGNGDWATTGREVGDLLPVKLSVSGQVEGKVSMKPTDAGKRLFGYILSVSDKDNPDKAWDDLNKQPLEGMTLLSEPRDDLGVVLARAEDGKPLLVAYNGASRVLAFAGDTTWRWKRNAATQAMQRRFWQRVAIWLARQDETEGSLSVVPDTRRLPIRDARGLPIRWDLGFKVELKSKTGAVIPGGTYKAVVVGPDGERTPVAIIRSGTEERGTFTKTQTPGEYRLEVSGEGKDEKNEAVSGQASRRFLVDAKDDEMQRRGADPDFLNDLATAGGGKAYQAKDLPGFLRNLQSQADADYRAKLIPYPNWRTTGTSPFLGLFFVLFVTVVGGEWLLRRRWGMV